MYAGHIVERAETEELYGRPAPPVHGRPAAVDPAPRRARPRRAGADPGPAAGPVARDRRLPVRAALLQRPGPLPQSRCRRSSRRRDAADGHEVACWYPAEGETLVPSGFEAVRLRDRRRRRARDRARLRGGRAAVPLLRTEGLKVHFPITEGLIFAATHRRRARRGRRLARRAPRRDARPGGRVRLRQVDVRAGRDPAGRRRRPVGSCSTARTSPRSRGTPCAGCAAGCR